ncbi:PadR family transcriptional regulator [Solimonas marina]|uniref:PadR family transcriptional regulator n=1 Tax=Solimonas marina TaxID=2714601 RepID=A0A969WAE2_9GAMM|nr:PadR family transcriptional regulator [Solimonas marina]NKF21255.1 PadR family transcriptional regulator [Solimonas marina]
MRGMYERFHQIRAARHGGRHHGFFGFGGFDNGFPEMGDGRFRFGAGRKLGSADLQLLVLSLLAEKPGHGYELIKALEEKSKGYYSPSPGVIYPALTYLEEIGYASVQLEGTKKRYHITDDGLTQLETQRETVDALLQQLAWIGERMAQMRETFSGAEAEDDGLFAGFGPRGRGGRGGREGRGAMAAELRQARHALKAAMIEKVRGSAEQQKQIAEILERAAEQIRAL